jgi:DNA helicase II / ATP-dependent DNA helicase PcrA
VIIPSPQQRAIIDHPLEPLRVAAGAGTGKTTTIALRLARLVSDGTVEPESALGITFTNKAAEELADRLRRELPELAAVGRIVEVTTYHGFAYRLLQEFGAHVGVERDAQVVGPGYTRQMIHEALAGGSYEELDLTATGRRAQDAAMLASQLGENLAAAADLLALDEAGVDPAVRQARVELAGIVARYQAQKERLRAVDYADLIRLAHRLVTEHPAVARRVRDRYGMVLLDEYQDTNPAQRELLRAIFGDGFPVTAVGDTDQTIYEWRGASLANFESFPVHFPPVDGARAPTLPLSRNRRSGSRIVELANEVRRLIAGADPEHPLVALDDAGPGEVRRGYFATSVAEAAWIAEEIRRLHDEEDLAWRDVAVLFRKNRHIPLVRDALEAEGVPVEVVSLGGLLSVPEVTDLHAWLRILGDPDDTPALVRILLGSRYRLGLGDLAPLARWSKVRNRQDHEGPGFPMLEAVDALDEIGDLPAEASARLAEFRRAYRSLLSLAQGVTLVDLCRRILDTVGAWADVDAMSEAAALSARLNLYRFLDLAEQWSPLEGRPSLDAFLAYLEVLTDEQSADELDTARVGGEDAVSLLTVHRAKGLEWDAVFLPAVARGVFPAQSLGYDDPVDKPYRLPYTLRLDPDTLPPLEGSKDARRAALRSHHLAQERRAAYVAVTRARHRLYLTGAHWYNAGGAKPSPPSELWEAAAGVATTFLQVLDPGPAPDRLVVSTDGPGPDPLFGPDGWPEALRAAAADPGWAREAAGPNAAAYDARVDQFELMLEGLPDPLPDSPAGDRPPRTSVTGLVTLAGCPKRFYWSEVDPLPRRPGPAQRRGVELHRRIELHNRGVVPLDEAAEAGYDLVAEGAGDPDGDPGGGGDRAAAVAVPDAYAAFTGSRFASSRPVLVEAPFDLVVDGARVSGRVDAVYRHDDGLVEIVDFKSGRAGGAEPRRVQLQAYAVAAFDGALELAPPERLAVTFAFFGSGEVEEESEEVDAAWLEEARNRLGDLVTVAADPPYPETPSPACRSCDFLRFCDPGRAFLAGR